MPRIQRPDRYRAVCRTQARGREACNFETLPCDDRHGEITLTRRASPQVRASLTRRCRSSLHLLRRHQVRVSPLVRASLTRAAAAPPRHHRCVRR